MPDYDFSDMSDLQALFDLSHLCLQMRQSIYELKSTARKVDQTTASQLPLILTRREGELISQALRLATIAASIQITTDATKSLSPPPGAIELTPEAQTEFGVELDFNEGPQP